MKLSSKLRRTAEAPDEPTPDAPPPPPMPPRGAPVSAYAGILDGQTLWLAVAAAPGTLALREDGTDDVHPLRSDIPEDDPAYRSVRADLRDLPGEEETAYDVVLVPPGGKTPRAVWIAPFPTSPTRVPLSRDGRWQFGLGRTEDGLLRVRRTQPAPALDVVDLSVDDEGLRVAFAGTDGTELRVMEGDAVLGTFPVTRDGDRSVAVLTDAGLPEGSGQLARLLVADTPLRRRANDLANPNPAVLLPALFGEDTDLGRLRFRWSQDGYLLVRIVDSDQGGDSMRIAYVVFNLDGMGGTSRSAVTQANALAGDHDVRLVSVTRSADQPHYDIDPRIAVEYLVDVRDETLEADAEAAALYERESVLVPTRWDGQYSALTDLALQEALPGLDVDVVVTVTPSLLAVATQLVPDRVILVHQEHRSSSDRTSGLEPLLAFAPRADVVAMLTPTTADWLREQLGEVTPEIVVMPNPLPLGFTPRSKLDNPVIMSAV